MSVLTKCPQCSTVFRVSAAQLRVAGGWVRCGRCATEFNAIAKLTDSSEDRAIAINLEDGAKPESDLRNLLVTEKRTGGMSQRLNAGGWSRLAWSLGSLLLIALLAAQFIGFEQARLERDPELRPWLGKYCAFTGCTVSPYLDRDALELRRRDVREDPERPGAMEVNAIIVNRAAIAQRFPKLELALFDEDDRSIGHRRFAPTEYLGGGVDLTGGMAPGTPYHLKLDILAPNPRPARYRFVFR